MSNRPDEQEGSGPLSRRGARAYQWALEAAMSLPIAIGLGYWADQKLDTGPIFLIVGVMLGFGAFVLRLLRMRTLVEGEGSGEEASEGPASDEP